ncbi:hypothetical protein [Pseudonocardia zijingensis]|jgi:hypothetical protein|uniref:Uncharacterized protein n=1 Tax=Pseudonocardia zijingensis TaxID=153376 RepID=A0ABN1N8L7_9PSEU
MSGDHDYSGDYGYDLAHEVNAALAEIPRPRRATSVPVVSASAAIHGDLHGDLGYDSAHEGGS